MQRQLSRLCIGSGLRWMLLLAVAAVAEGLEAKCSACSAVVDELVARLDREAPRNHLDMRHRLDKDGKRYGPVIEYKLSELRMVELLEGLCKELERYEYRRPETDAYLEGNWVKKGSQILEGQRPDAFAMAKHLTTQLINHCYGLLEEHEDSIIEAIRSNNDAAILQAKLCKEWTGACRAPMHDDIEL